MALTLTAHGSITTVPATAAIIPVMTAAKVRIPMATIPRPPSTASTVPLSISMAAIVPPAAAMSVRPLMQATTFPTVHGAATMPLSTAEQCPVPLAGTVPMNMPTIR